MEPRTTGTKICHGPSHKEPVELSVLAFNSNGKRVDGLEKDCRDCKSLYNREYYRAHRKLKRCRPSNWVTAIDDQMRDPR